MNLFPFVQWDKAGDGNAPPAAEVD